MDAIQNGSICLTGCVGALLESHFKFGKADRRPATQISRKWKRVKLRSNQIVFVLNTGQSPDIGNGPQSDGDARGASLQTGSTRLGRLIRARQKDLIDKFNSVRKNLPLKIFLLLLGFYSANALATILGQTGDWDVLVAGFLVAVIEGIGIIIYKMPIVEEKFLMIMRLINYWKAGLTFGLFVDAFKLGS
ncbi:hypothetical protein O6H91_06G095100 [Diphasiastrum complanatum]|uniref:Uncharacterized protein n=2 Tax=Diphasiastrum complanatum TaxID=34168 RepID=A0ACC2DGR6_DIPCM|nr:hypothetical protein O6H91_06G094700 [Diphasiastrum complanatum]KAJ7553360.1 hypothetical protein O6H91_06G095100 [Diphasiastrum complanatum]